MALATGAILGSIAASAAGAGISRLINGGSSASSGVSQTAMPNFSAGGLTGKRARGTYTVSSDPARTQLVGDIRNTFDTQADMTAGLRAKVAPGMSDLRAARLQEIEMARSKAVGDLRENLSRRRVLGSSFASDALSRAEAEFGAQKSKAAAETFLQEMDLTNKLIQEEYSQRRAGFQTSLGELNLQAETATKLTGLASQHLAAAANLDAQLAAQSAAGFGRFFGDTFAKPISNAVSGWFGGSGGGGSWAPTVTYGA